MFDYKLGQALKDFNMEYDSGDPWGSVMKWRFDIADELYRRCGETPAAWEYKPGAFGPPDADEGCILCDLAWDDLVTLGNLLLKFADMIKLAGKDY